MLGPMYHLFTTEDQLKALSEAIRVTKKGGILFAAYCMGDASVLSHGFVRGEIDSILEDCDLNPETFDAFPHPFCDMRKTGQDGVLASHTGYISKELILFWNDCTGAVSEKTV